MDPLIMTILYIVLYLALGALGFYLIDWAGIPEPLNKIGKVIVIIIVILAYLRHVGVLTI